MWIKTQDGEFGRPLLLNVNSLTKIHYTSKLKQRHGYSVGVTNELTGYLINIDKQIVGFYKTEKKMMQVIDNIYEAIENNDKVHTMPIEED